MLRSGFWRSVTATVIATFILSACAGAPEKDRDEPDTIQLTEVSFNRLPGWGLDQDLSRAMLAFNRTCDVLVRRPDSRAMGGAGYAGTIGHWRPLCDQAVTLPSARIQNWFEINFRPYAVSNKSKAVGLFTGYYEPSFEASLEPSSEYATPVYARPRDLVMVNLGEFRDDLKGRRIAGVVENGRLQPYADRAEITQSGLDEDVLVLVYGKDPVDVFFLQIQGSGKAILQDGSVMQLGYAGQNGHPYFAIGRALIERGVLTTETVSLQTIRSWLKANPDSAPEVMNLNPSYVFFREIEGPGPIGAANVPLTPERSLAVDRKFHPMGVPVWVSTSVPLENGGVRPLNHMMVMQDTGGAIRGPVRGDVFWGAGPKAEFNAGHMKQAGIYFVLLPKTLIPENL